jgi:hypothetical protein
VAASLDSVPPGTLFDFFGGPSINDAGDVAYVAWVMTSPGVFDGVFLEKNLVVRTGDTIGGKQITDLISGFTPVPRVNNHDEIAFLGHFAGGTGIFTQNRLLVGSGDVIEGKVLTSLDGGESQLAFNDRGDVAFCGFFDGSTHRTVSTPITRLGNFGDVVEGYVLNTLGHALSMNGTSTVVFTALTEAGKYGIFTHDKAIVTQGDVVEGRTIQYLDPRYVSMNDRGDVVFLGILSDGRNAVLLARNLEVIPEPSALALLLGLGSVGLLGYLWRRRRS